MSRVRPHAFEFDLSARSGESQGVQYSGPAKLITDEGQVDINVNLRSWRNRNGLGDWEGAAMVAVKTS